MCSGEMAEMTNHVFNLFFLSLFLSSFFLSFYFIYLFLEGGDKEKERERNTGVREKHGLAAFHKHWTRP